MNSVLKATLMYAVLAVSATAFFFFLHHLGNQLPYELAKHRMATALKENNLQASYELGINAETPHPVSLLSGVAQWEKCEISLAVLGGSQKAGAAAPFFAAVLLKSSKHMRHGYCARVKFVAVDDAESSWYLLKPRYWWGGKALHAIALRYFSVFEINELTKVSIYFAYLLLAIFLLRFAPRMLLIFMPLIVFGFFLSGIRYYPDMVNGLTYLWSVLAAVILTVLISSRASLRAVHIFCFVAGMISSYLWLFDGHTILISSLIALLVYFGYGLSVPGRARRAVVCVLFYAAGFLACFMLGQLTKIVVFEWMVINNPGLFGLYKLSFYEGGNVSTNLVGALLRIGSRMVTELSAAQLSVTQFPVIKYIGNFWVIGLEKHYAAAKLLTFSSALAFMSSLLFATVRARKGQAEVFWEVLFIAGLMAFISLQFLLPNDFPLRLSRFMFVPHALCWSCLILVVLDWRARDGVRARFSG